jgi:hypothetical protein
MTDNLIEKSKNQTWSERKSNERTQNCQSVYRAILLLGPITTTEIHKVLKEQKNPLSSRTIERCIKDDPRIIKNKKYYSISDESRFEIRYLNPKHFAAQIWANLLLNRKFPYDSISMKTMIEIFGSILVFAFIEASKPFQDKLKGRSKKMEYEDRNALVTYWALNSIPLDYMFRTFTSTFNFRSLPLEEQRTKPLSPFLSGEPRNEMEQFQIDQCFSMLKENYPDIYKDLVNVRNRFYENSVNKNKLA